MRKVIIILFLLLACGYSFIQLGQVQKAQAVSPEHELLYFPRKEHLKVASLGFSNVLSNYLWFQTVNYFGKHYRADQNYYWLEHMCNIITDLDPYHRDLYEFCSFLVAWENKKPEEARLLLTKGIQYNPDYWRFYYLRGMSYLMFDKNQAAAKDDFVQGSKCPEAPFFLNSLAAKQLANLDDPQTAVGFLLEMIENAKDPNQRASLEGHLEKTLNEIAIHKLEKFRDLYQKEFGTMPGKITELKLVGAQDQDLLDPKGELYRITKAGKINSRSIKERLNLFSSKESNEQSH